MKITKIIGKPTINPILFYSGKFSGYISWILLIISLFSTNNINQINLQRMIAIIFAICGLLFIIISFINLGKSTRLGIPEEFTELKVIGLYKFSRNPMYIGFNLLTVSAILFVNNFFVLILGIYSIFIYHLIILSEEKFLENRFG
jgi:protein-S-isoprenylcysteine O-methyltransferase Ste14